MSRQKDTNEIGAKGGEWVPTDKYMVNEETEVWPKLSNGKAGETKRETKCDWVDEQVQVKWRLSHFSWHDISSSSHRERGRRSQGNWGKWKILDSRPTVPITVTQARWCPSDKHQSHEIPNGPSTHAHLPLPQLHLFYQIILFPVHECQFVLVKAALKLEFLFLSLVQLFSIISD